jgi:hypothetical protein
MFVNPRARGLISIRRLEAMQKFGRYRLEIIKDVRHRLEAEK